MKLWIQLLEKTSQTKWLILLSVGIALCLAAMFWSGPGAAHVVPDLKFSYPASYVEAFFCHVGETGRQAYAVSAKIDLFYMFLYTLLLSSLVFRIYRPLRFSQKAFLGLTLFPLITLTLDLVETGGLLYISQSYPIVSSVQSQVIATATTGKWVSFIGVLVILAIGVFQRRRRSS